MRSTALPLLLLLTVVAAACGSNSHVAASAEEPAVNVQLVRVAPVEFARPFEAGGVLRARDTAIVASRVMAPIAAVHVRPGDRIRRGAVLVTLDSRESTANRERASAALTAAAEASRAADAEVRAAEAQLHLARVTHARITALHEKRSATADELDHATTALTAAEAQAASAQARAASALAAREAAVAMRDAATVATSYGVLTAPFDGIVLERSADPGSMAIPGVPLVTIEDASVSRLEVAVDEARASGIRVGQTIEYRLDNAIGSEWRVASVTEIGRVDPASHTFVVKVDLPGSDAARSGSFGRVRFPGNPRRALAVPKTAIIRRGQLTMVFRVDSEGRARLRPVSTGVESSDRIEILAGVAGDDTIVGDPPTGLADGARVVPR